MLSVNCKFIMRIVVRLCIFGLGINRYFLCEDTFNKVRGLLEAQVMVVCVTINVLRLFGVM